MIRFVATGKPEPQGSARAFVPKGWSRAVVTSDNPKNKNWRGTVAMAARKALKASQGQALTGPVRLVVQFHLPRPKALKASKPHMTRPDLDKLTRSVCDALTGICYADDGQVTSLEVTKAYTAADTVPRAEILVAGEEEGVF